MIQNNILINIGTSQNENHLHPTITELKNELAQMEKERLDYYKNLALEFKEEIKSLKIQNRKFRIENQKLKSILNYDSRTIK
jgi:hypothetical protein